MANILAELSQWANSLPYWEQAALEKIVSGTEFTDQDYDKLLKHLLEDAGLEEPNEPRPGLQFPNSISKAENPSLDNIRLIKICNLQNINILVPNQTITFGANLTAIFGANGSGKSSYVRALACAAFARGDKEVLPDATMPIAPGLKQSIDIEIFDGHSDRTITYQIGQPCSELTSFYVFDATSVQIHLSKQNKLSFTPFGLSYLKRLADETDRVRARLQERIKQYLNSPTFIYLFQGDSDVSRLIAKFESENNIVALKELASLTKEEQQRIDFLDTQISKLKSLDISDEIGKLRQQIKDLEELSGALTILEQNLGERIVDEVKNLLDKFDRLQSIARNSSADQFRLHRFAQTGTKIWNDFAEAARKLAEAEQTEGDKYPGEEDYCLLCHQPLTPEARDLLIRLWSFLGSNIKEGLDEIRSILDMKKEALTNTKTDLLDESSVAYRHLKLIDTDLLDEMMASIKSYSDRRNSILAIIDEMKMKKVSPLYNKIKYLRMIIHVLNLDLKELEKKDQKNDIARLEKEQREFQHRNMLNTHMKEFEGSIERRLWAQKAAKVGGSTKHITAKHNDLFKRTVTQRFIDVFECTLQQLERPLKVRIETTGKKGETLRQIVLETDPSVEPGKFPPDKVLSEGEKRAVALADFLTEVMVDENSCGIILDDPVTSLDFEWKDIIASRLVMEANERQVVIFTHDLHFLYLLKKRAEDQAISIITHWIKKGEDDNIPGYVYLDNSPALEHDYQTTKRAHEFYDKAKNAQPEEQEILLKQGFGALRSTYEAFIIYDLFNEVVLRFDERISFGRLAKIVWDKKIAETVVVKCESLSRLMEGHLHSDAFSSLKPTPKMLIHEIEEFEKLKKELKKLKK